MKELPGCTSWTFGSCGKQPLAQTTPAGYVLDEVVVRLARADERVKWDALMGEDRLPQLSPCGAGVPNPARTHRPEEQHPERHLRLRRLLSIGPVDTPVRIGCLRRRPCPISSPRSGKKWWALNNSPLPPGEGGRRPGEGAPNQTCPAGRSQRAARTRGNLTPTLSQRERESEGLSNGSVMSHRKYETQH